MGEQEVAPIEPYLFQGRVLPERAQITLQFSSEFSLADVDERLKVDVSIVLNQLMVWVFTRRDWDILHLRNVVASTIQHHLAMTGFLLGRAYDFELSRVANRSRDVDYVFGIDIPCLADSRMQRNVQHDLRVLSAKSGGDFGIFLQRCFTDLVLAMRHAEDTGFYCYRAIEALRHHCTAVHGFQSDDRSAEWAKFREISGQSESNIRALADAAKPLRHGEFRSITDEERQRLYLITWSIVEGYLGQVEPASIVER